LLLYTFAGLFALLLYWLLGFVMRDIGTWPGREYQQVEKRLLDQQQVRELTSVQNQIDESNRAIASRKERQKVLRDSTSNSEKTMNQLLELQKQTLQRGLTPSPEEVKMLAESEKLFLANQAKYQEMNDQVASLTERQEELQTRHREVREKIEAQRPAVQAEFNRLNLLHQRKLATLKLSVLVPLLGLAVWLFLKKRGDLYAPLVYGFGLAVVVKVVEVMHQHFPTRHFKYILIILCLLLVARVLVYLLRAMAFPKPDWLLKQYREAYEHFLCPVCGFPIRRGPLKHLFWTRSSLKKLHLPVAQAAASEETYVCPMCATPLFEECEVCKAVRHSLLPACAHCGAEKKLSSASETRAQAQLTQA
jgi:predicted RNA-binding Zn-ribbon protein involved in translation (DUF1610 family)